SMIAAPVPFVLVVLATQAVDVGLAPALPTHTDSLCVVESVDVPSVSCEYVTPWPVTPVGSDGDALYVVTTNATSSEFACGVHVGERVNDACVFDVLLTLDWKVMPIAISPSASAGYSALEQSAH